MMDSGYVRLAELTTRQVHLIETRTSASHSFDATPDQLPNIGYMHACFLTEGTIEERRGGRVIARRAPNLRLSPAGDAHHVRCGRTAATCSYIRLEDDGAQVETLPDG